MLLAAAKDARAGGGRRRGAGRPLDGRARDGGAGREVRGASTGKWLIPLRNTTQQPMLASLDEPRDRARRSSARRGRAPSGATPTTRGRSSRRLAALRARKAALLGYPTYAAWVLEDQMAKTPDGRRASSWRGSSPPADGQRPRARRATSRRSSIGSGGAFALEPWDWDFYAEQVRKAQVRPRRRRAHALLRAGPRAARRRVLRGAAALRPDVHGAPRPSGLPPGRARLRGARRATGTPMALFYCDYFARDNKNGGAWMRQLRRPVERCSARTAGRSTT
ncbi:MAG: M3 family metallopeptidase [Marinilabiliales bacterium]|nr:M3 family metallopeptidase [Marinilabiliales bacterium]